MGICGSLLITGLCRYVHSALEDFGLQTEESYAMKIIRRTVVGASTLGLTASLLTGAFAQGAELPKRNVLTLEAAQRVVQAAKKEAADHSWACVIAVAALTR
jgi:hypothetical protein